MIFARWSKKKLNKYAVMVVPSQDLNWKPCKITYTALAPYYPSSHLPRRSEENHENPPVKIASVMVKIQI